MRTHAPRLLERYLEKNIGKRKINMSTHISIFIQIHKKKTFSCSCDTQTTFCFNSVSNETNHNQHKPYTCFCQFGYYVPNQTLQGFEGHEVETTEGNFSCIPCPVECALCDHKGECINESPDSIPTEALLRFSIATILGLCMFCCLILAIIVFRQRKCKVCSELRILSQCSAHFQ